MALLRTEGGVDIFYRYSPKGKNPTVIFLHGLSMDHSVWEGYADRFCGDYGILTVDLRGHGRSGRPEGNGSYVIGNFSRDLHCLIRELGIKKFYLVGFSFGCMVAVDYLRNYSPKALGSVLISPPVSFDDISWSFKVEAKVSSLVPHWVYRFLDSRRGYSSVGSSLELYIKCLARTAPGVAIRILHETRGYRIGKSGIPEDSLVVLFRDDEIVRNKISSMCADCRFVRGRHKAVISRQGHVAGLIEDFLRRAGRA